jgi:NAD-dependent SIR2 family protein deacetylase
MPFSSNPKSQCSFKKPFIPKALNQLFQKLSYKKNLNFTVQPASDQVNLNQTPHFPKIMKSLPEIHLAAKAIKSSNLLLITAGAGMGVDSGLPDFRGPQGFWRAYPAAAKLGLTLPETSNPQWFHRDPYFIWAFFGHRHSLYKSASPHNGFEILKNWCKDREYFIFTSNVDGQFQKSGFPEAKIVECHGSIHYLQCFESHHCTLDIWEMTTVNFDSKTFKAKDPLPKCIHCGKIARPNILMFGDHGWISDRTDQQRSRLEELLGLKKWKICVVECGAGDAVYTVRAFGEHFLFREKAGFVRVNPEQDNYSHDGIIQVKLGALEGLSLIDEEMKKL